MKSKISRCGTSGITVLTILSSQHCFSLGFAHNKSFIKLAIHAVHYAFLSTNEHPFESL